MPIQLSSCARSSMGLPESAYPVPRGQVLPTGTHTDSAYPHLCVHHLCISFVCTSPWVVICVQKYLSVVIYINDFHQVLGKQQTRKILFSYKILKWSILTNGQHKNFTGSNSVNGDIFQLKATVPQGHFRQTIFTYALCFFSFIYFIKHLLYLQRSLHWVRHLKKFES